MIGLGEPPTVSTAAAIALAVRNATGVTMRSLPLTPAKVLGAMRQRESLRPASNQEVCESVYLRQSDE